MSCFQWCLRYDWPRCAIGSGGVGAVNWKCYAAPFCNRRTPSAVVNIQAPASLVRSDLGLLPSLLKQETIYNKTKYSPRFARSDAAWLEPLSTRYAAMLMPANLGEKKTEIWISWMHSLNGLPHAAGCTSGLQAMRILYDRRRALWSSMRLRSLDALKLASSCSLFSVTIDVVGLSLTQPKSNEYSALLVVGLVWLVLVVG